MLTCLECETPLAGRQTAHCSQRCRSRRRERSEVVKARKRRYRERHREAIRARMREYSRRPEVQQRVREWRAERRETLAAYNRRVHLRRKYGITPEEYDELLERQGGTCALCPATQRLCVDHDHDTGRIRGLLCAAHNRSLGTLGDTPGALRRVLGYLEGAA